MQSRFGRFSWGALGSLGIFGSLRPPRGSPRPLAAAAPASSPLGEAGDDGLDTSLESSDAAEEAGLEPALPLLLLLSADSALLSGEEPALEASPSADPPERPERGTSSLSSSAMVSGRSRSLAVAVGVGDSGVSQRRADILTPNGGRLDDDDGSRLSVGSSLLRAGSRRGKSGVGNPRPREKRPGRRRLGFCGLWAG